MWTALQVSLFFTWLNQPTFFNQQLSEQIISDCGFVGCQTAKGVLGHLFVGSGHFMAEENKSAAFLNLCPKAE